MKPTANGHNYPEFSVKESRANLSSSIKEKFKLEEWTYLVHKHDFQEILVQGIKLSMATPKSEGSCFADLFCILAFTPVY